MLTQKFKKLNCPTFSKDFFICSGLTRENVKQIIHDFVHLSNNLEDLLENPLQILSGFNLRGGGEFHSRVVQCKNVLIPTCVELFEHHCVNLTFSLPKSVNIRYTECRTTPKDFKKYSMNRFYQIQELSQMLMV